MNNESGNIKMNIYYYTDSSVDSYPSEICIPLQYEKIIADIKKGDLELIINLDGKEIFRFTLDAEILEKFLYSIFKDKIKKIILDKFINYDEDTC